MKATTARRPTAKSASSRDALANLKSNPYGKTVLRAIDRMKAAGPWKFCPRSSSTGKVRRFKTAKDAIAHLKRV
jgi:hypothetical protein